MILKPYFEKQNTVPLAEYPRPQFRRDSYLSLNGLWDFMLAKENGAVISGKINVPYSPECDLSGVLQQVKGNDTLIYNKTFTLPSDFNVGKVLLNFGAVDQVCKVFVNGCLAGENAGGYNPFTFDITSLLNGEENLLTVEVKDDASSDIYGRGKQVYKNGGIWYKATSGIWQSVFLESVPNSYLESVKFDVDFDNKKLLVTPKKVGYGDFTVTVMDGEEVITTETSNENSLLLDVSACKPWSVDCPELYRVILTFNSDRVESYFGLRKFSMIEKNGYKLFALNNEPIFHNGLLDQGYYEKGMLTPKTNEAMFKEIKAVKDLGFNMLRKHIKVEPLLWYYYCDILGVLVWQDMINGGGKYKAHRIILAPFINLHINDKNYKKMGRRAKSREQYYKEAFALQDTLYNCVSLCLYTPFNEAWGQFDAVEVTEILRKRDSSRLYDHASGWQDKGGGDLLSRHIYFRKVRLKNDKKRILALTEFGGYSLPVIEHLFTDKKFGYKMFKNASDFENAYAKLYKTQIIREIEKSGLSATVYTQLTDIEDEINGLFTFDRVLKISKETIIKTNKEVYKSFNSKFK
ncbi:MAG: glycoside hydrolase family 2 [Clostridia bacterium]|nr:glycoside hydrolase family 2 [Clostridia bacterium]